MIRRNLIVLLPMLPRLAAPSAPSSTTTTTMTAITTSTFASLTMLLNAIAALPAAFFLSLLDQTFCFVVTEIHLTFIQNFLVVAIGSVAALTTEFDDTVRINELGFVFDEENFCLGVLP